MGTGAVVRTVMPLDGSFPSLRQFPHVQVLWPWGALSTVAPSCVALGPENSSCPGLPGLPALSLQPWETAGLCLSIHSLHRSLETPTRKLGQLWGSPHLYRSPRRQCPFLPNVQCLKTIVSNMLSGCLTVIGRKMNRSLLLHLGWTPWIHNSVLWYVGVHSIKS